MERGGYVYILTNKSNQVLYTGVTSNLYNRIFEHKSKAHHGSFTARYNVNKLVYYEFLLTIEEAITREKQIKGGSRKKKLDLINFKNPKWLDLFDELIPE
ncbi:MAG: GIY-YIG nuclease family protein [Bacteroidales bacterium]|nr:GIY-YIG nuclease family protein [Bacteroidales bacterium]